MEKAKFSLGIAGLVVVLIVAVLWIYHPGTAAPNGSPPFIGPPILQTAAPTKFIQITPTPLPCKRIHQTAGQLPPLTITNLKISNGCVLIVDSDQGTINGTSWSSGGILAFEPGTYNGLLTNGEYDIIEIAGAKQEFCSLADLRSKSHQALSRKAPLPGWGNC